MSDLVRRVACTFRGDLECPCVTQDDPCQDCMRTAHAAICAVFAHFAEAGNVTDGMQQGYERLFDAREEVHTRKAAIAAAMAAALKEIAP